MSIRLSTCGFLIALPCAVGAQIAFEPADVEVPDYWIQAITAADYDNDGRTDLFIPEFQAPAPLRFTLLHNESGRLVDRSEDVPPITTGVVTFGSVFGDYDRDGDVDLFIPTGGSGYVGSGGGFSEKDVFLRNDEGAFTDVTDGVGLATPTVGGQTTVWLDADGDGYLDLHIGQHNFFAFSQNDVGPLPPLRNLLYYGTGGPFRDGTVSSGLDLEMGAFDQGTAGGIVAADLDDDGRHELYLNNYEAPNRLFRSDGAGAYDEIQVTGDAAFAGPSVNLVLGDVDGDLRPDLLLANGLIVDDPDQSGRGERADRLVLLKNLGDLRFVDVTAGAGLTEEANFFNPALHDFDNDGDLDLLLGEPPRLYVNHGGGFEDQSHLLPDAVNVYFPGDFNDDGVADLVVMTGGLNHFTRRAQFYQGVPTDNQWLQVELVGRLSNPHGFGARLYAYADTLAQRRDPQGGDGNYQHGTIVHFGLGRHESVDSLRIEWPSGQSQLVTDIPTGQRVRIFEGIDAFHPATMTDWISAPPRSVVIGRPVEVRLRVQPSLFEPEARIEQVIGDLSDVGGPVQAAFTDQGDGTYAYDLTGVPEGPNRLGDVEVRIRQWTFLGRRWTRLAQRVELWPAEDLVIYGDDLAGVWTSATRSAAVEFEGASVVQSGQSALNIDTQGSWQVQLEPSEPVSTSGYRSIRFAFHPGDVDEGSLEIHVSGERIRLESQVPAVDRIDWGLKEWQAVELELVDIGVDAVESVWFSGNTTGTFYLDDIRMTTKTSAAITAVTERLDPRTPATFALSQNYPNPFNPETTIRFDLPSAGQVDLAVYNMAGQRVAELASGYRETGSYTLRWDGTDDVGRALASGVYFYRLVSGEQVESRKLLLLR